MASSQKYFYLDGDGKPLGLLTGEEAMRALNLPPRPADFHTYNNGSSYPDEESIIQPYAPLNDTSRIGFPMEGTYSNTSSSGYAFTAPATVEPELTTFSATEASYKNDYGGEASTHARATMSGSGTYISASTSGVVDKSSGHLGKNNTTRRSVKTVPVAKYDSPSRHVWKLFSGGHDDRDLYRLVTKELSSANRTEGFTWGNNSIYYCRCNQRECSLILLRRRPIKSDAFTRRCARCTRDGKNDLIPPSTTSTAAPTKMDTMWPERDVAQGSFMPTLVSTKGSDSLSGISGQFVNYPRDYELAENARRIDKPQVSKIIDKLIKEGVFEEAQAKDRYSELVGIISRGLLQGNGKVTFGEKSVKYKVCGTTGTHMKEDEPCQHVLVYLGETPLACSPCMRRKGARKWRERNAKAKAKAVTLPHS